MPVVLEPVSHRYYHTETEKEYLSVSKLLSLYKPKFDPTGGILVGSARKASKLRGVEITPQQMQAEWFRKNKDSTIRGTHIHLQLENFINHGITLPISSQDYVAVRKFSSLVFDGTLVSEQVFWNDEFMVAGTSDLPCYNHAKKTGCIYDFKTDKEVNFTSKYDAYHLDPISHLENCEWSDHALQLSFYSYFMELKGYKIKNPWIFWIKVDKETEVIQDFEKREIHGTLQLLNKGEEIVTSYKVADVIKIPCPYLKFEVMAILADYKKRFLKTN